MTRTLPRLIVAVCAWVVPSLAHAVTYEVGPTRRYTNLGAVAALVNPGDLILVDGGATYPSVRFTRPGTVAAPVTVRGLIDPMNARPVLEGGTNTIEFAGSNYVFENFEVRGGMRRCIYHHADNIVVRNTVVHDCPAQGILGADQGSGDLTLEYVEVYRCGAGSFDHQIYMATDEVMYPGSVFRMQHCFVHAGVGGNAVKSRAERNEIYYNWIEGALYHELELIGPDPEGAAAGWTERLAREDSDVVGNVLRANGTFPIVRVGGDGTGQSLGRYRFVNNTFISNLNGGAVIRVFLGVESIEMHNNVFYATAGLVNLSRTTEAAWVSGEVFEGDNNWVPTGTMNIPRGFRGTITGASPTFVDAPRFNYMPMVGSPLIDRGVSITTSPMGRAFPRPLALPRFHPPVRRLLAPGTAVVRPTNAAVDLGAFESGPAVPIDAPAMDATVDGPTRVDVARSDVVDVPRVDAGAMLDVMRTDDGQSANDARVMDVQSVRDVQVVDVAAIDVAADEGFDARNEVPEDVRVPEDMRVPEDVTAVVDVGDVDSNDAPTVTNDVVVPGMTPAAGCGCTASNAHARKFHGFVVLALAIAFRRRKATQ